MTRPHFDADAPTPNRPDETCPRDQARRKVLGTVGRSVATFAAAAAADFPAAASARQPGASPGPDSRPVVLDRQRLDSLAEKFHAVFNEGTVLPAYSGLDHAARFDVELRRISTFTRIPGSGERVQVSGLLATPVGLRGDLPLVSWQHGTILSFDQVPSNLMRLADTHYELRDNVDSLETLFNLHRFAAQGFVVIAADYLGKGPYRNGRAEAYAVKEPTVQCCMDVLDAGMSMLRPLGIRASRLMLNGWSQGGLNTQWLGLELQRRGVHVDAAAAQSPFNNLPDSFRYWCGDLKFAHAKARDYPALPAWLTPCLVVLLGSYRAYGGLPDLFQTAIRPEHRAFAEAYWRDYALTEALQHQMPSPAELLVDGFFEHFTADGNTRMLAQLAGASTTYSHFPFPATFYYGLADEALPPELVRMLVAGGGAKVRGVPVQRASHRATFLASLYGGGDAMNQAPTVPRWFTAVARAPRG